VCGRSQLRGEIELNHRIAHAWGKFHQHRQVLLNRNVPIHLRLKLFDSTVSPTVLYGMAVLPLTAAQLQRLGAVQRRMLRNITGWVRIGDEPWEETMRRMKHRVERALGQHSVQGWPERLCQRRWDHAWHVVHMGPTSWPARSTNWDPTVFRDPAARTIPYRGPGRPLTRWDDTLAAFSTQNLQQASWQNAAEAYTLASWRRHRDAYVQHCLG
jgi:hypothetical protein